MVAHPVIVRGLSMVGADGAPTILQRTDQEFLPAVLEELRNDQRRPALASTVVAPGGTTPFRLYQPVHRTFHIAVVELVCDSIGTPRLDPAKVDSAGLMVRRVASDEEGNPRDPEVLEGWMSEDQRVVGWRPLRSGQELSVDPDPERRRSGATPRQRAVDQLLEIISERRPTTREASSPLFVAPPEVCKSANATILYGVIPVTSTELTERLPLVEPLDHDRLRGVMPSFFRSGQTGPVSRADVEELLIGIGVAFEPERANPLMVALEGLEPLQAGATRPVEHFRQAVEQFANARPSGLPAVLQWQPVSEAVESAVISAVGTIIEEGTGTVVSGEGRFAGEQWEYRIEAFVRVKRDDPCPPALFWSRRRTDRFRIVPWYEGGVLPPTTIALPDVTDLNALKKLKPTVAFVSPENVFNRLKGMDLAGVMDKKTPSADTNLGIEWICGFSIPIVTICALIVLTIFLALLNFVFWWLPFCKICFPIPKRD